jgi:hypothetical protein
MLYVAMLVLLTVSPGFLIGRRPGSTPAAGMGSSLGIHMQPA